MWPNITEWLVVLFIVLILFGAGKVPKLAEDLGKSVNAFRKGLKDGAAKDGKDDSAANPPSQEG